MAEHLPDDGYCWWYVDLVDREGSGLVLIWSWGLPLVRSVQGHGRDRPARVPYVNLCWYDRGRLRAFALDEYPMDGASMQINDGGALWRMGRCRFESSTTDAGSVSLRASVDFVLPGGRPAMRATVDLTGPLVDAGSLTSEPDVATAKQGVKGAEHLWSPRVLLGAGHAALWEDDRVVDEIAGDGYHDANLGTGDLSDSDLRGWWWGHAMDGDQRLVYYVAEHRDGQRAAMGFRADRSGEVRALASGGVHMWKRAWSLWGPRWFRRIGIRDGDRDLTVEAVRTVENGPFYVRHLTRCVRDGKPTGRTVSGVGEYLDVQRLGQRPLTSLVNMRVHHVGAENARSLPLFYGLRERRLQQIFSRGGDRRNPQGGAKG